MKPIRCRNCRKMTPVTTIKSDKGTYVGYSCECGETVTLTKAYPTAAQAKKAWESR